MKINIDINNLPEDAITLHSMIVDITNRFTARDSLLLAQIEKLSLEVEALNDKNQSLVRKNRLLLARLAMLRHKYYGQSSERIRNQLTELELRIEENETEIAAVTGDKQLEADTEEATETEAIRVKPTGRKKLPEHLEREEKILEPNSVCTECGSSNMRKIGDDISEVLEYVPSSFKVIKYIRPRCACNECDKIVQAYAPSLAIDKGKAGPGLLAHILIQKYCNHLPLYRQSEIYEREGIDLSRSTMASWVGQCSKLLAPLIEEIRKSVFASSQIHGDDTPVRVLSPGLGRTKTGRIWCYLSNGKNYGDDTPPAVCYYYSPDRKGARPLEHLAGYKGVLHADAYSGFDKLYEDKDGNKTAIEESACWAHARRKFYEITVTNDNAAVANEVLKRISDLYKVEENIRGLTPENRLSHRQQFSKDKVEDLFAYIRSCMKKLPAKGVTSKAINYFINNEAALKKFLSNGKLEIDNNPAERALRSIAIGRKNYLFAGSDTGGASAANMYTLIETAKLNNINPWQYLQKVLTDIQDYNSTKLADLLPWNIILQ